LVTVIAEAEQGLTIARRWLQQTDKTTILRATNGGPAFASAGISANRQKSTGSKSAMQGNAPKI